MRPVVTLIPDMRGQRLEGIGGWFYPGANQILGHGQYALLPLGHEGAAWFWWPSVGSCNVRMEFRVVAHPDRFPAENFRLARSES